MVVFDREPAFRVVAQAGTLAEARKVTADTEADLGVIDLSLPDGEGVELIKDLREANPHFSALVLTASLDRADHARAVEAGAAGVLHKSADVDDIIGAARRLASGQTLLSSAEIVELLRADPGMSDVRILLMTARGSIVEKRRGLALGADGFIAKPFELSELRAEMMRLLA